MKRTLFHAVIPVVSFALATGTASAGKLVIIVHQGETWQLQDAEKITINGKVKTRRGAGPAVAPAAYKQLTQETIGAVMIRRHRAGYLVEKAGTAWAVALPDGAAMKAATTADRLWADASIVVQADKSAKPQAYRPADVFAILPGTAAPQAAVAMLMDESNFIGLGEKNKGEAFDERMSMLVGVSGLVTGPAQDQLKAMLANAMKTAIQRSGAGTGRYAEVVQGLGYSSVSQKAFPSDAEQTSLRNTLRDKKSALDRRIAILKAFSAATEWDSVIDKYGDFEQYDDAFADLHALHDRASKESEAMHTNEGKRLETAGNYAPALDEIQKAILRNPGNRDLQTLAERIRIEKREKGVKLKPVVLDPVKKRQILQFLTLSDSYIRDGKLDQAEQEIASSELIQAADPSVVLARAKLLRARHELNGAVAMIDDKYNGLPLTEDEITAGDVLKTQIQYEKTSGRDTAKKDVEKAEEEGDYPAALKGARAGLQLDPSDPELLYRAGVDAAITRNIKDAREFWQGYLANTQTLTKEAERRKRVLDLLPQIGAAPARASTGAPHWFSNNNVAADLMYDPVSLMSNPHPLDIKGSKKDMTTFEWVNGELRAVRTTAQIPGFVPVNIFFDYRPGQKGVRRVGTQDLNEKGDPGLPKLTAEGAAGTGKGTYVVLANDPVIDPLMLAKLTGKQVGTIVSGNAYFNPFIWDDVHVFLAEYDADGHVKSAKAIRGRDAGRVLDFSWQGDLLMGIVERGPRAGTTGEYRREMHYMGNRLLSETVTFRGKTGKISYHYNGDRLAEADSDESASLDGRSHKVTFAANR
jgi:tetratricopeptide (TPR) repeat protein